MKLIHNQGDLDDPQQHDLVLETASPVHPTDSKNPFVTVEKINPCRCTTHPCPLDLEDASTESAHRDRWTEPRRVHAGQRISSLGTHCHSR